MRHFMLLLLTCLFTAHAWAFMDESVTLEEPTAEGIDEMLQVFFKAMFEGDLETLQTVVVPHDNLHMLAAQEPVPEEAQDYIQQMLANITHERLAVGDPVMLGQDEQLVTEAMLENQLLIRPILDENPMPVPFALVIHEDAWRIDVSPLIEARRATQDMRERE